jgi:type I restriction enzyme, S subunit
MTELPESWLACTLGDVTEYGSTEKAEPNQIPSEAWVLELEDVERDTSRILQRFTFGERKSKSTKNRFQVGDVLYGKLRPYLNKVVIADDNGYCSTEIIPLRPNDIVLSEYLFYWLKHPIFLDYVASVSHGLNMPRLGTQAGKAAPFVLAPRNEQKRIAHKLKAILGRVDACRSRLDGASDLFKRLRQAVLAAATSGKLSEDWRDEAGNGDAAMFAIDLDRIKIELPNSWQIERADSVCSSVRDGTHDTPKYVSDGIPLITSKNIRPAGIDFEDAQEISLADHKEISKRSKVDKGDILFSMIGSVGHVCLVETEREFSIKNVGLFKSNRSKIEPKFMFFWLQSPLFMRWLNPRLRGGNQKFASLGLLRESPVIVPPFPEQQEIVRRVEVLFAFVDRIESSMIQARAQAERLTLSTLAKAFRGELVSQDPTDEPASALLELFTRVKTIEAARPKREKTSHKRIMKPSLQKSARDTILSMKKTKFTFSQLREAVEGDYEALTEEVFCLLAEEKPKLKQIFSKKDKIMQFIRSKG